ncbi:hypothetical protein D5R40_00265 [Okeania hirsuta]|uniref:Uncharacterized protein n=1 Tax=Okeania hirsuta TaxID=1458930 RepID=A0A3N6PJE4_9CYAN|nr:hypothetical protein D5R40_00265 [Okeania hirsuta]
MNKNYRLVLSFTSCFLKFSVSSKFLIYNFLQNKKIIMTFEKKISPVLIVNIRKKEEGRKKKALVI